MKFLPRQLQNLPISSVEVPWDGRLLIGRALPGMLLCSQGPEGSPKTQSAILMSFSIIHPPDQAFLTSLLKLLVSTASYHCVSAGTGFLAPIPLACLVGVISFPEPEGEMRESAPLFSFFSQKSQSKSISVNLLSPQPSKGLSPHLPSLKTSYSFQRVLSCIFLGLYTSPCQPGPEPLQMENTALLLI